MSSAAEVVERDGVDIEEDSQLQPAFQKLIQLGIYLPLPSSANELDDRFIGALILYTMANICPDYDGEYTFLLKNVDTPLNLSMTLGWRYGEYEIYYIMSSLADNSELNVYIMEIYRHRKISMITSLIRSSDL